MCGWIGWIPRWPAGIPGQVEGEDCSRYILTGQEDPDRVSYLCACPGGEAVVRQFEAAGKDPLDLTQPENRTLSRKLEGSVMDWMRRQGDGFAGHWAAGPHFAAP